MIGKILSLPIKHFSIKDYKNDDRFMQIEIWGCCEGQNPNKSSFDMVGMLDATPSLQNSPILCYIDKKINDATGHVCKLIGIDENGNPIYNYDNGEKIVGIVNESSNIRIEERDGKNWTVYTALIFVNYNYELKKILQRDKIKSVSIEIRVLESEMIDDIEHIGKFKYLGTTILGAKTRPGISGAMLKLFGFNNENFDQFKRQVAFALSESSHIDKIIIPETIKSIIENQMITMKNYPMSTTEEIESLITAKDLVINEDIAISEAIKIVKKIKDYQLDDAKIALAILMGGEDFVDYVSTIDSSIEFFISKEDMGTGEAIKINLTKQSASNDAWGGVDKTKLRNDILKASNYKSLVDKCYLVVESGWGDHPSESLKFPVCQIKNNILVYNINGAQSARSFLERNQNEPYYNSANSKLNKIYKKLGLDYDKKHMRYNEKEVGVVVDKFKQMFSEENKFNYISNDEKYVYARKLEDGKFVSIPYCFAEEDHIVMNSEKMMDAELVFRCHDAEGSDFELNMSENTAKMYDLIKTMEEEIELSKTEKSKFEEEKSSFEETKKTFEEDLEKKKFEEEETKKTFEEKITKLEEEKKIIMEEKAKFEEELKKFKEEKFESVLKKFTLSESDAKEWKEKSNSYSSFDEFEKDIVFALYRKPNGSHLILGGTPDNKDKKPKNVFERLNNKK